ncbi:acetyl-CoA carboxylase biotin carboxylase subunit family protein [Streptomyces sp. cmx-4-9]|uniref:ATP-grasp domain-containing protein n=1 Tax=Streptomyces sp. cmx-4-9 TaxID=2790941 RepID=UPI00397F5037
MRSPVTENRQYLLVFGATMALRERAVVAALRVFDGPLVTIARSVDARAAKFFDHVLTGDFSDPDTALRLVLDFEKETGMRPAGVVPFIDPGLVPGRLIADHYGLPFLSRQAIEDSGINKNRMKDRLLAAGVATPRYVQADDLDAAYAAVAEVGLPCVVKPSAFGGSLGVRLVRTQEEIAEAHASVRRTIDATATFTVKNRGIQVEEFCPLVDEVSVEVLTHRGVTTVLAVTDKSHGPQPYFAEVGHRVPSTYADRSDVRDLAVRACEAIGLDRGVAHVEIRLEEGREPQLMEVGARTAGDGIIDLVERALGISPYELHVLSYLDRLQDIPRPQPAGLAAIAVLKAPPGTVAAVRPVARVDAAVTSYEVYAAPGTVSRAEQANYLDREGYVECYWPGAEPASVPKDAHLDIAARLAAEIFVMEGAEGEAAAP